MSKVGLIGCGYWGKNIAKALHSLNALKVVSDNNVELQDALSDVYEIPGLTVDQILNNEDISAVAIATPAQTHAAIALECIRRGKDVFIEKPICLTKSDAERLNSEAIAHKKVLMVGHLLQYHPAFVKLKEIVGSGDIGTVLQINSTRLSLGKIRNHENALWSLAPHDISMVLSIINQQVKSIKHTGHSFVNEGITDDNRIDILFDNDSAAHIHVSWLSPFKEQKFTVIGTKGSIVFEDSLPQNKLTLTLTTIQKFTQSTTIERTFTSHPDYSNSEPLVEEMRHFIECIDFRREPRTNAKEASRVLEVLLGNTQA